MTEAKRASKRAWNLANRKKVLAQKERYRLKHRVAIRIADKAFYQANKEKRNAITRAWALANPEKVKASNKKHSRKAYAADPVKMIAAVRRSQIKRVLNESPEEKQLRFMAQRKRSMEFAKNHPDRVKACAAAYRKANREKRIEASRLYSEQNKEKLRIKQLIYRASHREIHKNQKHRRRARVRAASIADCSQKILELSQEAACHWCDVLFLNVQAITIDHVIPISRGGSHSPDNLVASCRSCNSKKHDKLPSEWRPNKYKEVA